MTELPLKDDMTKAAIDYLEKQGYSIVKWIEFDLDNKSTWPEAESFVVIAQQSTKDTFEARFYPPNFIERHEGFCHPSMRGNFKNVTRWAYLPTPKEK